MVLLLIVKQLTANTPANDNIIATKQISRNKASRENNGISSSCFSFVYYYIKYYLTDAI